MTLPRITEAYFEVVNCELVLGIIRFDDDRLPTSLYVGYELISVSAVNPIPLYIHH